MQVELGPSSLRVAYEVCLSEWTLYQDLKRLAPELPPGERVDRIDGYARLVAPLNARGLLATVDGRELEWRIDRFEVDYDLHPLLTFHVEAPIPAEGRLRLRDTNYISSYGTSRLALRHAPGIRISGHDGPSDLADVPERPVWALTDEEEAGTRQIEVDYRPADVASLATSAEPVSVPSPAPSLTPPEGREPSGDGRLTRLFWDASGRTIPLLLLAAFVIGAAHAVQPGHGKVAVVGASIQGPRPIGRGLLLAGTAAGAHLALAVALAVVAVSVAPKGFDRIDATITRAVGLALGILGAWRVGASLGAPTPTPGEDRPGRRVESARDAILAGLAIGAIPCWDAVLLLALAWVAGRALLGVALVVAFSVGAGATLLGVALAAGLFRTVARRLTATPLLERSLGTAGGLLLAGIGAYLFLA